MLNLRGKTLIVSSQTLTSIFQLLSQPLTNLSSKSARGELRLTFSITSRSLHMEKSILSLTFAK